MADSAINVGKGPAGIAVSDDAAWVANSLDGSLSRIDVEDLSVTSRTLVKGGGAYGVAAGDGNVWVSNQHAGTLMRVTARTFQRDATVRLRGAPLGLAFVGDDLWFTSAAGGSALHRGGVVTMVGPRLRPQWMGDPPLFDPTVLWGRAVLAADVADQRRTRRLPPRGRGPWDEAGPGPGHRTADSYRRRAHLRVPSAERGALLDRRAGAGR